MVHTPEIKAGDIDFLTVFPDGTLLKSASGEILYVNPAFLEMAKLDKQDLIGHYFADIEWKDSHYALFGKKEMEQALALEARLIATPEMHHTSEIYRKQFNTVESWVKIRALFLADKQQYLFFCQDVAHHKHFFSAVLPLTTELPEDELSDMLQHHVKETERLREQAEKASAELLVRVEEKERMERQLQDYIEHVQMAQFEAMKAKSEAEHVSTDLAARIADKERMEQQLQDYIEHVQMAQLDAMRAKEAAETANAAKSDFLANMSHELRTPMHAILNYSKTGLKRLDPAQLGSEQIDKLQKYFTNIYVSGQRLSNLINDLLDVSKMEAGKMDFRIQELSVLTPVEHAVSELQPIYESKNIKIDIRRETQDLDIHLDRERMIQVVVNLLSNAVRFSPEHSTITIRFTDMEYNGAPALATMIEDQGVGIPEAELETIFDKFIQSSKTATGAGGTGLGLAICTQILHAHHGHIWAENRPEGGARFTFVIPREQPQKLAEAVGE